MANSIEWAHASTGAGLVDPDDISSDYEGLGEGEIGVWLGSDAAVILYGTPEQVIACAEEIKRLAGTATPYSPITMTQDRLDYLRVESEAERLSWGEIAEIQGEFEKIDPATLPEPAENAGAGDMLDEIEARIGHDPSVAGVGP